MSCRNLLIYMDHRLQKRVLPLLHYSLNAEGLLFLGTSEDVGEFSDLFTPLQKKWKIFQSRRASSKRHHEVFGFLGRSGELSRRGSYHPEEPSPAVRQEAPPAQQRRESMRELVEKAIVEEYAPPGVLVDADNCIRYFHGEVGRYLTSPRGEAVFDLFRMAGAGLAGELEALMVQARKSRGRAMHGGARVFIEHRAVTVDLAARKLPSGKRGEDLYLVTFQEQPGARPEGQDEAADDRVDALQRELDGTRQDLQATIEMLETTNEELQSTNEELHANNEELQSTNEEMETSREELQSTNEELATVNAELERKNEEMGEARDDMNNLLAATEICTVILDHQLRILRFTPAATRIFRLIDSDRGRPITDMASILLYDELPADLAGTMDSLTRKDREVKTRDGQWFEVRILPYRTSKNVIAGAVLTLIEVTESKNLALAAREGRALAESILETLREPLLVLDAELRVVRANRAFCDLFPGRTRGDGGIADLPARPAAVGHSRAAPAAGKDHSRKGGDPRFPGCREFPRHRPAHAAAQRPPHRPGGGAIEADPALLCRGGESAEGGRQG